MNEALSDTGSILHLYEIAQLDCLKVFSELVLPPLVASELDRFGFTKAQFPTEPKFTITPVLPQRLQQTLAQLPAPPIHAADAEVFILAEERDFAQVVLTDDLALRRHLERHGNIVVGSVGILVRAYRRHFMNRNALDQPMTELFNTSSLHASPAFQKDIYNFLNGLT
jgi:predicted nucleic acid-binding protein